MRLPGGCPTRRPRPGRDLWPILVLACLGGCGRSAGTPGAGPARPSRAAARGEWEEIDPGRDSPPAGEDAAVVYDAARRRVLLYGGKDDRDVVRGELWSFDLGTNRWTEIHPRGPAPPPREDHSLVLDEAGDALVLFGGEDGSSSRETWLFDLRAESWKEITHESAPALEGHVAVYDPAGRRMVVFGGMSQEKSRKDEKVLEDRTWALDLDRASPGYGAWSVLETKGTRPAERREHRGAFDPLRRRLVVFGGRGRTKTRFLNDVWVLDLRSLEWSEIEAAGERPDPVRQTAVGYDAAADLLAVFGGEVRVQDAGDGKEFRVDEVWVLDLATRQWSNRTGHPRPVDDHSGVFLPDLGGTWIYGGSSAWPGKQHQTWLLRVR